MPNEVEVPASPTIRFSVSRSALLRVISDALTCACVSTDYQYIPQLANAEFTVYPDGRLTVSATDRFVLGTASITLPALDEDDEARPDHWSLMTTPRVFVVPLAFLRKLPSLIPAGPRGIYPAAGQQVEVTVYSDTLAVGSEDHPDFITRASVPFSDVEFVTVQKIVDSWQPRRQQELAPDVWLRPALLAKFAKVSPDGDGLRFELGDPGRASRVTIGDHFVGFIMPMRGGRSAVSS